MNNEDLLDLRKNLADRYGNSHFVADTEREEAVAGPFGSEEYAETVKERMDWPRNLTTVSVDLT